MYLTTSLPEAAITITHYPGINCFRSISVLFIPRVKVYRHVMIFNHARLQYKYSECEKGWGGVCLQPPYVHKQSSTQVPCSMVVHHSNFLLFNFILYLYIHTLLFFLRINFVTFCKMFCLFFNHFCAYNSRKKLLNIIPYEIYFKNQLLSLVNYKTWQEKHYRSVGFSCNDRTVYSAYVT